MKKSPTDQKTNRDNFLMACESHYQVLTTRYKTASCEVLRWCTVHTQRWCDEFYPKCGFFPQEPGIIGRHGSAPQIAVTESTPDRNRKLLLAPVNQLQVPSQYDCSSSVKVCPILLCHYGCLNNGWLLTFYVHFLSKSSLHCFY